ncbi:MAG: amidase [Spirochaetota bacterium]|jgi:Asp-tRNA(Asn)/Glu-tRNA(Gln) amidotransferase A subunit family amidase|nr:amidase [Spirochaetota bacterium]
MYSAEALLGDVVEQLKNGKMDLLFSINHICDVIDRSEPTINALVPETGRRERLLRQARELEKRFPEQDRRPPLYGICVGVKDMFRADGYKTTCGSNLPPMLFDGPEASSVTKLKDAGALVLGKTLTTEFAYFYSGPTRNPVHIEHTPGGSSSGSAAAVAAGYCSLAIGTQTIGSISRPAAYCGIIGVKPSYDRIARDGVIPFSPSADHVGFFTQDMDGARIVAGVLCDNWNDALARKGVGRRPRIALAAGKYIEQAGGETLQCFRDDVKALRELEYEIVDLVCLEDIPEINALHHDLIAVEMAETHCNWFDTYRHLYREATINLIEEGRAIPAARVALAKERQLELRERMRRAMESAGCDIFISPTTPSEAPKGLESTGSPVMNLPWTFAGMPTITVPSGNRSEQGLPFGLQFSGIFNDDERLIYWIHEIVHRTAHKA